MSEADNVEDFIKAYKQIKMQKNVIENIDKDYFTEFVDKLIEKLDDKDKRIKELEEELAEFNKQLDLDYVDENFIPKQVVIDKIGKIINETTPTPTFKPQSKWNIWDYERLYKTQPLLELLKGENK